MHDCQDEVRQVHENWIINYAKYMLPVGQLKCPQAIKSKELLKFQLYTKLYALIFGQDNLNGIPKILHEIPHKISHLYVKRYVFYIMLKI